MKLFPDLIADLKRIVSGGYGGRVTKAQAKRAVKKRRS